MTGEAKGVDERGFFERRPWFGAAAFGLIIVVTGIILVNTVTIRPHFRGKEWKLVTDLPPAGTGSDQGPARGLMPEEFRHSPVTVVVFVTLEDDLERPCGHIEVALVAATEDKLLSHGVTEPLAGTVHLPVPSSYDPQLFRGEVEALVMIPGMAPIRRRVPEPRKGVAKLLLRVPAGLTVPLEVRRADGAPFTGEAWVRVWPLFGLPSPHAHGIRVLGGKTRIGGLPLDQQIVFNVRADGFAEGRRILRFPTGGGVPSPVRIHMGPALGNLSEDREIPRPRPKMKDPFRRETMEEGAGDPAREVVVQFSDGIPAGAVKVVLFSSGNPLLSQVDIRARIGRTGAGRRQEDGAIGPGTDESLVLVHTAEAFAWTRPAEFPLFLELKPLGSVAFILHGLAPPRAEEWRYIIIEEEIERIPSTVRWWLRPAPRQVSSLGRCRFEGLLPGRWKAWLTTVTKAGDETREELGAFEIPAGGGEIALSWDI